MGHNNSIVALQKNRRQWLHFGALQRVVTAAAPGEVAPALAEVERAAGKGLAAAGFLCYEAAPGVDGALETHAERRLPLLWFGLFRRVEPRPAPPPAHGTFEVGRWAPSLTRREYLAALDRIRAYIEAGDTYQVNYTLRLRAPFRGEPYALFHALLRAQRARHCAFLSSGDWAMCSASPELFFALDGDRIVSRPMKGTAPRGLTAEQDLENARRLRQSEKNRAENIMIVDMVRNDLGRIARPRSVRVSRLFELERYPTVWQMTSTVRAETSSSLSAILAAIFPCASVTGAPKVRTMQIIRETEPTPRGVYTGAIGCVLPGRQAQFNVAIRTVVIDRASGQAESGVGGGVVWDSKGTEEYAECLRKAAILTTACPEFELLETLLWTPAGGYFLLDRHLARLRRSASYFGFPFPSARLTRKLVRLAAELPGAPHRVRLRVNEKGGVSVEAERVAARARRPLRVGLARRPVRSGDCFLYHKTTHREIYAAAHAARPDCDDVLLWNERREATESTRANLAVKRDGVWTTPPVSAGLLPGTFREYLLEKGRLRERVTTLAELKQAQAIRLFNSVRKWIPVTIAW